MTLIRTVGDFTNEVSGQTANREFNAQEAQKQREFEEHMSNTAYQRAVKDMQKAGLNPAAMYGGGAGGAASTPSGASASGQPGGHLNILSGVAQVINSAGYLTSTMNSKNEQKAKAEAYTKTNNLLNTAIRIANLMTRK